MTCSTVTVVDIFICDTESIQDGAAGETLASKMAELPLVYFVCDSASEFGAMGSTSFLGVFYPNLLLVFSEPVIFRNLYNIFLANVGTFSGSFLFYFSVPYFGLACDHGNSFLCLGGVRKKRVLDRAKSGRTRNCCCPDSALKHSIL